jgi:biotin carboxyl carrier protein
MNFIVRIGSEQKHVRIEETNGFFDVEIDGITHSVDCRTFGHTDYLSLLINNKCYLIESAPVDTKHGTYYANVMGRHYDLEVLDELLLAAREAKETSDEGGEYTVKSPMPGLIIDVKVAVGDTVEAGSTVVVMEAMKMQNALTAEAAGTVTAVHVHPNDTVDSQAPLVVLERTA